MPTRKRRNRCICQALREGRVLAPGVPVKCPVHKVAFMPPTEHLYPKEK